MKKTRICSYIRVSTERDGQKESYRNQQELIMERIKRNPDWELVDIYADPALTGTNDNRPEFQRMMSDARKHKFDRILVKSISRFARNTILAVQRIQELKALGIAIEFERENIDTSGPYSEMLLTILSALAQDESRNISERVKNGLRMRALNGQASWTNLYGYTKDGNKEYVIVEEEAEVIRRIFNEYEKGARPSDIASWLNEDGYVSPGGQDWKLVNIKYILSNPKYAGNILTNVRFTEDHMTHKQVKNTGQVERIPIIDHHNGIVTKEQFCRVQKIEEMKKQSQYPFKDMLTCPICGRKMKKARPSENAYYWCCEDDGFYIEHGKIEDAIYRAYEQLRSEDNESGNLPNLLSDPPVKMEYWWIDGLVDEVTFGTHYGMKDRTITVYWHDGVKTTVESKVRNPWFIKMRQKKKAAPAKSDRRKKRVRKTSA